MARECWVTPTRWAPRGEAWVDPDRGPAMVVWGGIPDERARVRVVHTGQNLQHAQWVKADATDPHRVHPPCDRYAPCGGCAWMHVDGPGQQAGRRTLVRMALDEEGLTEVALGASHDSPQGLADFRHVVKVGVGLSELGRIKLGAFARRTRRIVPIPKCTVAAPVLNRTMVSLAHHVIDQGIEPYDPEAERGVLRYAVLRASRSTGEVLVTLVAGRRTRALTDLAELIAQAVPEVVGVWLHVNTDPGNNIYSRDAFGAVGLRPLTGRGWIEETLGSVTYRIGPADFFQTNPAVAEQLYARTLDRLDPGSDDVVVDLYCGVGGLALQAAQRGAFALGVEALHSAVTLAREVARRERVHAEFYADSVLDVLPELAVRLEGTAPLVVVDPARRGLEDRVVQGVCALQPKRVAYISCNPRSMARDLAAFQAQGFAIEDVELFDMFPNTPHVECLVTLVGPKGAHASRRAPRRRVVR